MTPDEIETALQSAFQQCEQANQALTSWQKQIFLHWLGLAGKDGQGISANNPLTQLTSEERQALLKFVQDQTRQSLDWKSMLLNDWLQGQDSGAVQFIRDRYGMQWLEQVQLSHLAEYDDSETGTELRLKLGDRIEVTNGLWEWVQEAGPCQREWFPCTVIGLTAATSELDESDQICCVIRFDSGAEYEIQGIYAWNRPNWRWPIPGRI